LLTSDDLKLANVSANEGGEDNKFEVAGRGAAVFSRDGRLLALAGHRGRQSVVGLFEWPAMTPAGPEFQHLASVTSLSFRSDGSALMTSTADGTTHVWDLGTWKESLRIPPPGRKDTTAAFTVNGLVAIFQGSDDRRAGDTGLWVLPTSSDEFVNEACRRIARNLTPDEWTQFVGPEVGRPTRCPDRP
jgi:WD40 repeat protein